MQVAGYVVGDVGMIPLCRRDGSARAWTTVDVEDFDVLEPFKWSLLVSARDRDGGVNGYAVRGAITSRGRRLEYMHRRLLGLEIGDPRHGDHKDRDRLNNRRFNLRVVPGVRGNAQNLPAQRTSTSTHRGVWWDKRDGKWIARVKVDGRSHYVGRFVDELTAAEAAAATRQRLMPYALD